MLTTIIYKSPVYGEIKFTDPVLVALIQTPLVQRLKKINQLGVLRFLYFHPEHNRFNHVLGTLHLIQELFTHNPHFNHFATQTKLETMVAGLLHDIGHGPFSHDFENLFFPFRHENQTIILIKDPHTRINQILVKNRLNIDRICNLISGETKNDYAQTFISGEFDFDRLDYLLHDSYYTKQFKTKHLNWHAMLKSLIFHQQQVVFTKSALPLVEKYLKLRLDLYHYRLWSENHLLLFGLFKSTFDRINNLYAQKKISSILLKPYDKLWQLGNLQAVDYVAWNDCTLISWLQKLSDRIDDQLLQFFIKNILNPTLKNNLFILQDMAKLKTLPNVLLQPYHKFIFKMQVRFYQPNANCPILFLDAGTNKLDKFETISVAFNPLLMSSRTYIFKLW